MPPKAKAKAKAAAGKAKAKAAAGKAKAKAKGRPEPTSPDKRKEAPTASSPAVKKSRSSEALDKAKAAASSGGSQRRGAKVVDSLVPNAGSYKVYEDYAVKLNQTHIDANNNKFYIIQVLQGSSGGFAAWNRWGRVGEPGQNKLVPCGSADAAIKDFEKKFREKTQNAWGSRDSFKPVNGKYTIVETEDAAGGGQDQAPMGKLTEAQIGKGQAVLEKLDAELRKSKGDPKKIEVLSSEFYTLIPHNFGRSRPPAISTNEMLQAKVELLKFYLRMGFEEMEEEVGKSPVSGVMDLPLPNSLDNAAGGLCGAGDISSSNKRGAQLAEKQAGKPTRTMDASLYAAIMLYTSNAIYRDLNQALRDENRAKLKRYFRYLRLFFESMSCLPKKKVNLWRGLSVDLHDNPQYQVGKTVTWWGVSSCTADINVAKNFAKGCGGKCTVVTVESETASDISQITFYSNEKESLLAPGTQLKVKSNKRNGNITEITLKEVGRAIE